MIWVERIDEVWEGIGIWRNWRDEKKKWKGCDGKENERWGNDDEK